MLVGGIHHLPFVDSGVPIFTSRRDPSPVAARLGDAISRRIHVNVKIQLRLRRLTQFSALAAAPPFEEMNALAHFSAFLFTEWPAIYGSAGE